MAYNIPWLRIFTSADVNKFDRSVTVPRIARTVRQPILSATPAPLLNPVQVVSTKQDSTLVVVQTSESDRPREINDKQLLTLLADKSVALVRYAPDRTELISFVSDNP